MKLRLVIGLLLVVVGLVLVKKLAEPPVAPQMAKVQLASDPKPVDQPIVEAPTVIPNAVPPEEIAPQQNAPPPTPLPQTNTPRNKRPQPAGGQPAQGKGSQKPPLQDPMARAAMSLVGVDPDAEAYWLAAIFDSSLPDQEREDLIEDLNEEGLSDHKRPGPEDFPVIMNRLAIISEVAPHADEFMLPHLREAYKDLLNLADITLGGGRPVR